MPGDRCGPGLGAARTLTLINGRRVINSRIGADSSVDVNMIPVAMIERVEVIKDGASTRYGADAIGGVVNIVTRPQYDGIDVSLLTSTSEHGDGIEYDASAVTGFTQRRQGDVCRAVRGLSAP
ncbi:MAG TPA: TonB-dependent receptor plug domain-containing protein [Kofleriaceae bacterium]